MLLENLHFIQSVVWKQKIFDEQPLIFLKF